MRKLKYENLRIMMTKPYMALCVGWTKRVQC